MGEGRFVAGIVIKGLEHGLCHGVVDIVPYEVHQFEGPHTESANGFNGPIDGRKICQALIQYAQRFPVEWARHTVDYKTRGIFGNSHYLPPLLQGVDGLASGLF